MSTRPDQRTVSALIGLGGNIGDVVDAMQRALNAIGNRRDCRLCAVSKVYRTAPWGNTDQDWFFNACAEIDTELAPEAFLDLLLTIEIAQGRIREERWGPRTLDLDIIAYGDRAIASERLTVPHPRMGERAFVIVPLMDIAPDRAIAGRTVREYATEVDHSGIEAVEKTLTISAI